MKRRIVAGICLVFVASLGACGSNQETASTAAAPSAGLGAWIEERIPPGEPCLDAKRQPLQEVAAASKVPIWLPDSQYASRATLTGAWTCGSPDHPALTYGPIGVFFESGWDNVDPETKWPDHVEASGGWVETILGRPAAVEPVTNDEFDGQRTTGQVMVIVDDGILIRVLGDGTVPVEQLVDVAKSINLRKPVGGQIQLDG